MTSRSKAKLLREGQDVIWLERSAKFLRMSEHGEAVILWNGDEIEVALKEIKVISE